MLEWTLGVVAALLETMMAFDALSASDKPPFSPLCFCMFEGFFYNFFKACHFSLSTD